MSTIFLRLSLDRSDIRWENYLWELTPVERRPSGAYYKREDAFAPLGYGGINGAKTRQLIWLVAQAVNDGARGIITGASVLSPQVSAVAVVAAHYGLPSTVVLGGTTERTAARHENVAIAQAVGCDFRYVPVGFNPTLQREVTRLSHEPEFAGYYRVPYAISVRDNAPDTDIEAFHRFGAHQVQSIPPDVHTVHMTAGSCNSCVSVMYGLAKYPTNVQRLVLYIIGPDRKDWVDRRLQAIERVTGLTIRSLFHGRIQLDYIDLHGTKLVTYEQRKPATIESIVLHPTYEGKVMYARRGAAFDPGELFWIVASEPRLQPMARYLYGRHGTRPQASRLLQSGAKS